MPPENTTFGIEWFKLLKANHGALWLSGRPTHDPNNHFGAICDTICDEKMNGKLAAKLQASRHLANNPPCPRVPSRSASRPPPPVRLPAHSVDARPRSLTPTPRGGKEPPKYGGGPGPSFG